MINCIERLSDIRNMDRWCKRENRSIKQRERIHIQTRHHLICIWVRLDSLILNFFVMGYDLWTYFLVCWFNYIEFINLFILLFLDIWTLSTYVLDIWTLWTYVLDIWSLWIYLWKRCVRYTVIPKSAYCSKLVNKLKGKLHKYNKTPNYLWPV